MGEDYTWGCLPDGDEPVCEHGYVCCCSEFCEVPEAFGLSTDTRGWEIRAAIHQREMRMMLTEKQQDALRMIGERADAGGFVSDVEIWRGPTEQSPRGDVLMNRDTAWSLDQRGLIVVFGSDVAWVEEITDAGRAEFVRLASVA